MPRKKRHDSELSVIEIANLWTAFKVKGIMVGRISFRGPEARCLECNVRQRQLHKIGCKLEESPCGVEDHDTAWNCNCEEM